MPSPKDAFKFLRESYNQNSGKLSNNWRSLTQTFSRQFNLPVFKVKSLANKLRRTYRIKNRIPKARSAQQSFFEFISKRCAAGLMVLTMIRKKVNVLFFDESSIQHSSSRQLFLGTSDFQPQMIKPPRVQGISFFMAYSLQGFYCVQFRKGSPDSNSVTTFLVDAIRIYQDKLQSTDPIVIVLDNAAYQKSKQVKEIALRLRVTLFYNSPLSPQNNLIEDIFLNLKAFARKEDFITTDNIESKLKQGFEAFNPAQSYWIVRKFCRNLIANIRLLSNHGPEQAAYQTNKLKKISPEEFRLSQTQEDIPAPKILIDKPDNKFSASSSTRYLDSK